MSQRRVRFFLLMMCVLLVGAGPTGCAAASALLSSDGMAALNEPASVEVSLDRIEDIDESLKLVNQLLFETPIDENSVWVDQLVALDQPTSNRIVTEVRQRRSVYKQPQFRIATIKVLRHHTSDVLAQTPKTPSKYGSVVEALGVVGGEPGQQASSLLMQSKALSEDIARLTLAIETLDEESGEDSTTDERKLSIEQDIEALKAEREKVEATKGQLVNDFSAAVDRLGQQPITPDNQALMGKLAVVLGHVARMELEALTMTGVVLIQVTRALPNVHNELLALVQRWANDALKKAGDMATSISTDNIDLDITSMSLSIKGISSDAIIDQLLGDASAFFNQAVNAPARVTSIADSIEFQSEMLVDIAEMSAQLIGQTFDNSLGFDIP